MPRKVRYRIRRSTRGARKLVWVTALDSILLASQAVDDLVIVPSTSWKVVNQDANEKALLRRVIIHTVRGSNNSGAIGAGHQWSMSVLRVTDEGEPTPTFGSFNDPTFFDNEDVLQGALEQDFQVFDSGATPTALHSSPWRPAQDVRVMRKLSSDSEVRITRASNEDWSVSTLARALIQIV